MIINHNLSSLFTYSSLKRSVKASEKLLEKISSGMRINRAADDAAGLAISEKMRGQIRGLSQAVQNVQDGISLIQTAEGALNQSHAVLQRMRELAVKAASDNLTSGDRQEIQKEIDQCKEQLDHIALNTEFNGKKLLDGTASVLASASDRRVQVNVNGSLLSRNQFGDIEAAEGNYRLDIKATAGKGQVLGSNALSSKNDTLSESINVNNIRGEYSGITDFRSRGLMEGSYSITTRETPFGGITYLQNNGMESANSLTDLGITSVSTSPNPNIMPYGEYNIDIADQVPFMAQFADFEDPTTPDIITGVNATGRSNIDVSMDITAGLGASDAQSSQLWSDLTGPGNATMVTRANYDINMNTHFQVVASDPRDLLASNVNAVTYYRSQVGSTVDLNLTYRAQAGEQVVGHTTYVSGAGSSIDLDLTYKTAAASQVDINASYNSRAGESITLSTTYILEAGAQITLRDHDDPVRAVTVDVGGMTVDEAAAALEGAINNLDGVNYAGVNFSAVNAGGGQHQIDVTNNSGFTIDIIDSSGTAAAELGINTAVGGLGNGDSITGTARDVSRQHVVNAGSQDIVTIAGNMNTALVAYNTSVAAVDDGGDTRHLRISNGDSRHRVEIVNDGAANSVETELGLNGYSGDAGITWNSTNQVFHNHNFSVAVNDRTLVEIASDIQNAINNEDNGTVSIDNVQVNTSAGTLRHLELNNSNSMYNLTFSGATATELGFAAAVSRGGSSSSSDVYHGRNISVAVENMQTDQIVTRLNNELQVALGGDGLPNPGAMPFIEHDNGDGTRTVQIDNSGGRSTCYQIIVSNGNGQTASELGLQNHSINREQADNTGTALDFNREISFNVGGQTLNDIAATMDTALASYNIDVTSVDLGAGLSRLQFTNNGVPRHIFSIDNDGAATSLETELNIGGITVNPGGGSALSRRVYNDHTITVNVGDRHLDQINSQLNTAVQNAMVLDDLAANNGVNPFSMHDNGDGTRSLWVDNTGASNTLYDLRIDDNVNTTASELGLDNLLIIRGASDHSGTGVDFNRNLGTIAAGSNIEQCLATVQGWGFNHSANWSNLANTPSYDGSHHNGQFTISSTETGPLRREVIFRDSTGKDQLFGAGGDVSLAPGGSISTQTWQARDRVQVRTSYTGAGNNGTFYGLQSRTDWWWEGDAGTTNPLVSSGLLPFSSIYIPDNVNNGVELDGSWCMFTQARGGANHDRIDIETIDGNTGITFIPTGGLHFNDGVLDNNNAVLMPQVIRTGAGNFAVVNHDIDFGSIATQAEAVIYSERGGAGGFNHYAHAAYGNDTTYFFANGGDPGDYLQNIRVWRQEDDNASLLFTVLTPGQPPIVQVEGKGYNRDGTANDFGPLTITLTGGPITIGCIQFDALQVGGNLSVNDKFVINVAARAGGGYHDNPPVHSDANIAVSGNPWTVGGSTMEYRFNENAENGKDFNLLGYFVHPLNGGDNSVGVWTGSLLLEGVAAGGFAAGNGVGSSNVHLEINYNGTTDHRASALLTGYYFKDMQQGEAVTHFLSETEYQAGEKQNAGVVFEVLDIKGGQIILRGQAHIYDQQGNYRYAFDDYIALGVNNSSITFFNDSGADGLSFSQFNFADISRLRAGDRFSLFLSAEGEPADSDADEIYLFSSADRRDIYPHNWRFHDGVLDHQNTILRTYQVNYDTGDIHEGIMDFAIADFHGGTALGLLDSLPTPRVIDDAVQFESVFQKGINTATAHHYTKLKDIAQFWTPEGRFLLEPPQELLLQNGDKQVKIMLYGEDEIVDVLDRINQAIYDTLDQGRLVGEKKRYKFVSFVDSPSTTSNLEQLEGGLVVRSAVSGSGGEFNFIGPEPLLNALGISVLRNATNNELDIEVRDAVSGKLINSFQAQSDQNIVGALNSKVELRIDSSLGLEASYDEAFEDFTWQGEENIQVTVQLVDNATVLQMGANRGQVQWLDLMDASSQALGVDEILVVTRAHATQALGTLDRAIAKVSSQRSSLGAMQNRLDHSMNNLAVAHENLTASESRIRDADMAKNLSAYVQQGIISEAATAMLAQSNQKPQLVMQLLGK